MSEAGKHNHHTVGRDQRRAQFVSHSTELRLQDGIDEAQRDVIGFSLDPTGREKPQIIRNFPKKFKKIQKNSKKI